ncbi:hypothetical protein FT663_03273 [Candidozyma haemuli var. vulneris]|nr:hypothetical protein FT663_03273 [[Candida] haemuloni var. vulneris]KAF3990522.1 hypothetical protein FT662_02207 [[Candida] haemuloni var. vulneris]
MINPIPLSEVCTKDIDKRKKYKANTKLIKPEKRVLRLALPWEEKIIENESVVLLFQRLSYKRAFYQKLGQTKGSIIVFDCGAGFMDTIRLEDSYSVRVSDFNDLISQLKGIMTDQDKEISDREMNTLIIENLSDFYWTLRSSPQRVSSYLRLRDLTAQLKERYQCNIIVTSWDSDFEKGYNLKHSNDDPKKLSDLTFIPPDFYTKFDHIYAIGRQNYKYEEKWQRCT